MDKFYKNLCIIIGDKGLVRLKCVKSSWKLHTVTLVEIMSFIICKGDTKRYLKEKLGLYIVICNFMIKYVLNLY